MSGRTTETETIRAARGRHYCDWCGQGVERGESYKRYRAFGNDGAGTVKMHPECYDAMQDEVTAEGGWIEWVFGENERPQRAASQEVPQL